MKDIDYRIIMIAIAAIAAIEITAIINGINGQLMLTLAVIIAGLAGLVIPSPIKLK